MITAGRLCGGCLVNLRSQPDEEVVLGQEGQSRGEVESKLQEKNALQWFSLVSLERGYARQAALGTSEVSFESLYLSRDSLQSPNQPSAIQTLLRIKTNIC